jgi:RimJ/RimL family protein N-acetyltransferase
MLPDQFRTARLFLRPIAMADAGPIFKAYERDPEVTQFLIWRPHRTRQDIDSYIRCCLDTPRRRARTYVLQGRKDSVIRGCFDLRVDGRVKGAGQAISLASPLHLFHNVGTGASHAEDRR